MYVCAWVGVCMVVVVGVCFMMQMGVCVYVCGCGAGGGGMCVRVSALKFIILLCL